MNIDTVSNHIAVKIVNGCDFSDSVVFLHQFVTVFLSVKVAENMSKKNETFTNVHSF